MQAEQEAREAQSFSNAVLAATPDLTLVLDLASGSVAYGPKEQAMLGLTTTQLTALRAQESPALVHPDDQHRLQATNVAARALRDGEVMQVRYRRRHTDHTWQWMSRRITPFRRDSAGAVVQVLAVTRDVTDAVQAEDRLSHAALHDSLTGLPNRSLLIDRLDTALDRSARDGREVAVLFCDLDGFKRINDTFGHATGDAVLIEAAKRISGVLRTGDTVARVGGDEFVLVVEPWNRPTTGTRNDAGTGDRDLALQVAARIAAVLSRPVAVDGVEHVVTASIGIAYAAAAASSSSGAGAGHLTADQVVQDADAAMYRAKALGKDRAEVFEHALRVDLAERGRVEQLLRQALRDEPGGESGGATLSAAYQPVVDAAGALRSFEALARLTDADGVAVVPDVFIPIAEDTGQIRRLGVVMLNLACGQLAAWRRARPDLGALTMAVNVSGVQAQQGALEQDVRSALAAHRLQPRDLTLELTETTLLQAADATLSALHRLREDGVGISIDDFGTGYASLRYLAILPVSEVKIDRSFTSGLPTDHTSQKIVNAVIGLAADLELTCVVEGVETEEQRDALSDGVHLQGWLIGRPMSAEQASLLVQAQGAAGPEASPVPATTVPATTVPATTVPVPLGRRHLPAARQPGLPAPRPR